MGEEMMMTVMSERLAALAGSSPEEAALLHRLLAAAPRGLGAAYLPVTGGFAQTVRGVVADGRVRCHAEGHNLRYTAMAALGLARVEEPIQREVLAGRLVGEVVGRAVTRAVADPDPGAVALAAWAAAEVGGYVAVELFERIHHMLESGQPLPTVDASWMLTAATVARAAGPGTEVDRVLDLVVAQGSRLLLEHQGARGIYPHWLPSRSQPRWRAHVGSFADQVYPLQALARASTVTGDGSLLSAAEATAQRICQLQGPAGQWWWHYDSRDGNVVEGYPVYSVHQHAMAPMVLGDLVDAGGADHLAEVAAGLSWLRTHPEVSEELVHEPLGLVWRKVGRREPRKAARALGALTTALRPGLHLPGVDRAMPPRRVDHECRPYELGWMLYAWLPPVV